MKRKGLATTAAAGLAVVALGAAGARLYRETKALNTATAAIIDQLKLMYQAYESSLRLLVCDEVSPELAQQLFPKLCMTIRFDTTPWDLFPTIDVENPNRLRVCITGPTELLVNLQRKVAVGGPLFANYQYLQGDGSSDAFVVEMEVVNPTLIDTLCRKIVSQSR